MKDVLGKSEANKEEIEEASKKLSEELQKVGAAMYASQQKTEDRGQKTEGEEEKAEEPGKKEGAEEGEVVED